MTRLWKGGISRLQYHIGSDDCWKYRGGEFSGRSTPVIPQYPVEGITSDNIKPLKPSNLRIFDFALQFPRLRVLSVCHYTLVSNPLSHLSFSASLQDIISKLPPTLETLELLSPGVWRALLEPPPPPAPSTSSYSEAHLNAIEDQSKRGQRNRQYKKSPINDSQAVCPTWLPLKALFPNLKHLILKYFSGMAMEDEFPPHFVDKLLKNFLDVLPGESLELLDVEFLIPKAFLHMKKSDFPKLSTLTISTLAQNHWQTPSPLLLFPNLPVQIYKLVLRELTLTTTLIDMLPKLAR